MSKTTTMPSMRLRYTLISGLIGLVFLVIAILNFLNSGGTGMAGSALFQAVLSGAGLFWLQVAAFLLALFALYGLIGWLIAWLAPPVVDRVVKDQHERGKAVLFVFLLTHLWIILLNASSFPASTAGRLLHPLVASSAAHTVLTILGSVIALFLLTGLVIQVTSIQKLRSHKPLWASLTVLAAMLLGGWFWLGQAGDSAFPVDKARPNVVVIGIDGWRPDTVPQWGGDAGRMPFLEGVIDGAAYVEETVTPHARSFPAWWTILTGQNPANHGARFNLIDETMIRSRADLPLMLGKQGYHRIFAIDERRFAPIREEHGFDEVVGPGLGAADFLVGGLNDTPLGNLIVNTWLGRWLFPYSHANRAVDELYRPETFDRLLARSLQGAPRKPLFLATHFELPHWPYTWANGPEDKYAPHPLGIDYARYLETLERVDQQAEHLFQTLENLHVLDNAIVIVLADHGESFPLEDTSWRHESEDLSFRPLSGHGTSVMDLTQHRVPLAIQWYGREPFEAGIRRGRASLADVYPTILELLDFTPGHAIDGISLAPILRDKSRTIPERPIPLETGLAIQDVATDVTSPQRLLSQAAGYYDINATGLVQFRREFASKIIQGKRRAVLNGGIIAAPFTVESEQPFTAWRLAEIEPRTYWDEVAPLRRDTPIGDVTADFCRLFANDAEYLPENLCEPNNEPIN